MVAKTWRLYLTSSNAHFRNYISVSIMKINTNFPIIKPPVLSCLHYKVRVSPSWWVASINWRHSPGNFPRNTDTISKKPSVVHLSYHLGLPLHHILNLSNSYLHILFFPKINFIIKMIKSRRMRWVRHIARIRAKRNAYRILVGKPEGKRSLGRPRNRRVDKIKMDLWEIGWDGMDWINMAQDRDQRRALVNTEMNLRVP
jgi:hypothetical protein